MMRTRSSVLTLAAVVSVAGSLEAQSFYSPRPAAPALTGFSAALVVQDNEIFVGRSGMSPLMPLLPNQSGAVLVYRRENNRWRERDRFSASDAVVGDLFGRSIAVHGNTVIAGSVRRHEGRGAAYVFTRDAEIAPFAETAVLEANDGVPGDSLGRSVAVDGDIALVGAPSHRGTTGAAYVFRRDASGNWSQVAKLEGDGIQPGDQFGAAVALANGTAIVGAPGQRDGTGGAFVFRLDAGSDSWSETDYLQGGGDKVLAFGTSVSFNGIDALVAAPATNNSAGAVFAYQLDEASGQWREKNALVPGGGAQGGLFGTSVGVGEDVAFVGAPGVNGFAGAIYIVERNSSGDWGSARQIAPNVIKSGDAFGARVAVGGAIAVAGALGTDFGEGTGFVFERDDDGQWQPRTRIFDRPMSIAAVKGGEVECSNGTAGAFDCGDVNLVSFLPISDIGGERGVMLNDVWGWTDPETGKEYALVGRFDGTAFVDISNPENPVYVGSLARKEGSTPNLWRDIKVYKDHAFIVADGAGAHGVQVFDLTELRNHPNPADPFQETAHYDRIHSAHNIVINEETGYAYTVGNSAGGETCGGALHMINIQDPTDPKFAGCFADSNTGISRTGYTHDAQCVVYNGPDAEHQGKEVCFNASETALGIADVTDKENTTPIANAAYPNVGYSHQGWLTEDQRYFYLNDELDEIGGMVPSTRTLVWDVADLDDPILVTEHLAETGATDHNLYIRGNLMYQSNYVSGLRIYDISEPENPREVAFFDTVPFGEDVPGFAGSFSNYPFFESGVIVVTSMKEGLFILKKAESDLIP